MRLTTLAILLFPLVFMHMHAQVKQNDTLNEAYYFEIETQYDCEGIPHQYSTYIKTPICEEANCYIVEIIFYFDLIGRFLEFDTLPGRGLTKLDHIPFVAKDYIKLHRLLKDPDSPIAGYRMEELVKDTRMSELDGFTGATVEEVKEIVINGGVYSCFTLWHIAHGELTDTLRHRTISMFDDPLVTKLVAAHDQEANYFLLRSFSDQQFMEFIPQLLKTFDEAEGYYLKHAIEEMPAFVVNDPSVQAYFAGKFQDLNYFYQVALLKKFNSERLSDVMKEMLERSLGERNTMKNQLIRELLEKDR